MNMLSIINQIGASDGPSYIMIGNYVIVNPVLLNPNVMTEIVVSVASGRLLPLHHDGSRGALLFEKVNK